MGAVERTTRPFVLLDNEPFARLSTEQKVQYIQMAMDAIRSGTAIVTSNIRDVPGTPDYLKEYVKKL